MSGTIEKRDIVKLISMVAKVNIKQRIINTIYRAVYPASAEL